MRAKRAKDVGSGGTLTTPSHGAVCHPYRLGFAMLNPCIKSELSIFTDFEDKKGKANQEKGLVWCSPEMTLFDRSHVTSRYSLLQVLRLCLVPFQT